MSTSHNHVRSALALGAGLAGGTSPHIAAYLENARALSAREAEAARRKLDRLTIGRCPCGLTNGEARCPVCDDGMSPGLLRARPALSKETTTKITAVARCAPPAPGCRPKNRLERRAELARRRRGAVS